MKIHEIAASTSSEAAFKIQNNSGSRDRALRKEKVDYWSVQADKEAIDKRIKELERKLLMRRD